MLAFASQPVVTAVQASSTAQLRAKSALDAVQAAQEGRRALLSFPYKTAAAAAS